MVFDELYRGRTEAVLFACFTIWQYGMFGSATLLTFEDTYGIVFLKRTTILKGGEAVGQYRFGYPCGKADEVWIDKTGSVDLSVPCAQQGVVGI